MTNFNFTTTDPRERLMIIGNQLLDATYELEKTEGLVKAMTTARDDKDALAEMMKVPGTSESLITAITLSFERQSLTREYIMLRQTIEALTGGARPAVA